MPMAYINPKLAKKLKPLTVKRVNKNNKKTIDWNIAIEKIIESLDYLCIFIDSINLEKYHEIIQNRIENIKELNNKLK